MPFHWMDLIEFAQRPMTMIMFVAGLLFGSFFNVCINRIPEGTFWTSHRSQCPHCGAPIPFYLNIPLLGFVMLRGRARCCGNPISWQYPLIELATAIMFVFVYWRFPFVGVAHATQINPEEFIRFIHAIVFCSAMLVCSVIDIKHMIIPDVISLPMIALTPVVVYFHPELAWQSALIGVIAGGGLLYGVAWIYWLIRREVGMGMGDMKLLAAIGGWLGYQAIIPTVFYGSVMGAVVGSLMILIKRQVNMRTALPFGPFLALGSLIYLFAGQFLQELFLR